MTGKTERNFIDPEPLEVLMEEYRELKVDISTIEGVLDQIIVKLRRLDNDNRSFDGLMRRHHSLNVKGLTTKRQISFGKKISEVTETALMAIALGRELSSTRDKLATFQEKCSDLEGLVRKSDEIAERRYLGKEHALKNCVGAFTQGHYQLDRWIIDNPRVGATLKVTQMIEEFVKIMLQNTYLKKHVGLDFTPGGRLHQALSLLNIRLSEAEFDRWISRRPQIETLLFKRTLNNAAQKDPSLDGLEKSFFDYVFEKQRIWDSISPLFRAHLVLKAYCTSEVIPDQETLKALGSLKLLLGTFLSNLTAVLARSGIEVIGVDIELLKTEYDNSKGWTLMPHGDSPLLKSPVIREYLKGKDTPSVCYVDISKVGCRTTWGNYRVLPSLYYLDKSQL